MSKTYKDAPGSKDRPARSGRGRQRNISVRAVRRDPPDLRKLSRALISLAMAEAAAETDNPETLQAETPPNQTEQDAEDPRD